MSEGDQPGNEQSPEEGRAKELTDRADAQIIRIDPRRADLGSVVLRLVRMRKQRKMSQKQIAVTLGVSQGRVSQVENLVGHITFDTVRAYAAALQIDLTIVTKDGEPKKGRDTLCQEPDLSNSEIRLTPDADRDKE